MPLVEGLCAHCQMLLGLYGCCYHCHYHCIMILFDLHCPPPKVRHGKWTSEKTNKKFNFLALECCVGSLAAMWLIWRWVKMKTCCYALTVCRIQLPPFSIWLSAYNHLNPFACRYRLARGGVEIAFDIFTITTLARIVTQQWSNQFKANKHWNEMSEDR